MSAPVLKVVQPSKTELTVDDKKHLRDLLAGVFDEDKGIYLDSSDDKVAAELVLPVKLVREYREAAFGPLKSFPEWTEIDKAIASLEERSRVNLAEARGIAQETIALRERANGVLKKYGVQAAL